MSRNFQQSIFIWYEIVISDQQAHGVFKPFKDMRSLDDEQAWGPTQWMYFMQGFDVTEAMRLAMIALFWQVAVHCKEKPAAQALPWLALWESLHHTRAEYSKRTGCEEYALITKFDFIPQHHLFEIQEWSNWLSALAKTNIEQGIGLDDLVPFMAYYPWTQAIAQSCPCACEFIDLALARTFSDVQPAIFYAQHQWVVWCFRHRHPNDTYDTTSLMHRLFSEHSLAQLAIFWHNGKKRKNVHTDGLLPDDIPKIWQRPLFAGCDITDSEMPEWQQAWIDVISTPKWARRLSFWVAMVRVRRNKSNPQWLLCVSREHSEEWNFFENMHSLMAQIPLYQEPVMTTQNMDTFRAECLDYEYKLARALWSMYNNEEAMDILPLPSLEN